MADLIYPSALSRVPFAPYPLAARGDDSTTLLFQAVGEAITYWEIFEELMANIFNTLVRPSHLCPAAERAFLAITAPGTRRAMLAESGKVFFRFFPDADLNLAFHKLLKSYDNGCQRRNEIAHGYVSGHINPGTPDFSGYYLGPHFKSPKKRNDKLVPAYLLSTIELKYFIDDVNAVGNTARTLNHSLLERWRRASQTQRERY